MGQYKSSLILLGAFLAIGLTMSGYFIGQTMYNGKVALNTAEAKGLAERTVEADEADWRINFSISWKGDKELASYYSKAEENQKTIIDLLKENGLKESEIDSGLIDYSKREFRNKEQILVDTKHYLNGSIKVTTKNVKIIKGIRAKVNKLITQGIAIDNGTPSYHFTKLNDIKPEMLSEATKNARVAANEFAKNANVEVGGIRSAVQGTFIVRDQGESYGDSRKIMKNVRIVTTIRFYLTESI